MFAMKLGKIKTYKDTKMYNYSHQSCFSKSLGIWEVLQQSIVCWISLLWWDRMLLILWHFVVITETSALAQYIDNWAAFCIIAALDWNESKLLKFPWCSEEQRTWVGQWVILKCYTIWFTKLLCCLWYLSN